MRSALCRLHKGADEPEEGQGDPEDEHPLVSNSEGHEAERERQEMPQPLPIPHDMFLP
jgi:hypothetical protein